MKRKSKFILLLIFLFPFLTSCWDVNEPNRMLYVYGFGADYVDGKYTVYVQLIDFLNIAKSEQPNPEAIQVEIGQATGDSIEEAVFKLYQSTDIKLYWGHLTFMVFSKEAIIKNETNELIDFIIRYHETRYNTWIYTTQESVKDVLLLSPVFNKSMSIIRLADPKNSFEQNSTVEPITLRKMIIGLNEPGHEVAIPNVKIVESWESEEKVDKAPDIGSVSILSPNGLTGFFDASDVKGLRWMSKETKRAEINVEDKKGGVLSIILYEYHVDVKPIVKGKDVTFDIQLKMNATVSSLENTVTDKEIIDSAQKTLEKEIKHTFEVALKQNADIYRLSEVLYRDDVKIWKAIEKDGKIPLTKDSIRKITVKIEKVTSSRKKNIETIK